ncbi:MAG: hypothetical protein J5780_04030 [Treponema sp.]|nr:hypothetical protein [Treponema sp.]
MKLDKIPCFGVAGNFAEHLEQAGEDRDFAFIKTETPDAPKAVFPTYIPTDSALVPDFLKVFPFDSEKTVFPEGESKIQMESECAVLFKAAWNSRKLTALEPFAFGSSNDVSIRKEGAKKISLKKNWGKSSKGLSSNLLPLDDFSENGTIASYSIASFLVREGKAYLYGETSSISSYNYIYKRLIDWLINKFNTQKDEGPQEEVGLYLKEAGFPDTIMVSIGATRYTDFGKNSFVQNGDTTAVLLFPHNKYDLSDLESFLLKGSFPEDISALVQEVSVFK